MLLQENRRNRIHSCHRDLTCDGSTATGLKSGTTIVLLLQPLKGFAERYKRFRRKIIHPIANTSICIKQHILKRWHLLLYVWAFASACVNLYSSKCLVFPYQWWITLVLSSGYASSLEDSWEYSRMISRVLSFLGVTRKRRVAQLLQPCRHWNTTH